MLTVVYSNLIYCFPVGSQQMRGEKPKPDAELGLSVRVDAAVNPRKSFQTAVGNSSYTPPAFIEWCLFTSQSVEVTVNPIAADANEG